MSCNATWVGVACAPRVQHRCPAHVSAPPPLSLSLSVAVEFSEFVIGFDLGDIAMFSGTPSLLEELVPGLRYRFQVPDAQDGTTDA